MQSCNVAIAEATTKKKQPTQQKTQVNSFSSVDKSKQTMRFQGSMKVRTAPRNNFLDILSFNIGTRYRKYTQIQLISPFNSHSDQYSLKMRLRMTIWEFWQQAGQGRDAITATTSTVSVNKTYIFILILITIIITHDRLGFCSTWPLLAFSLLPTFFILLVQLDFDFHWFCWKKKLIV